MTNARAKFPKGPFRILTDLGDVLMLPPHLADEIRNAPQLNFTTAIIEVCFQRDSGRDTIGISSSR
jgi:hypothetical protein